MAEETKTSKVPAIAATSLAGLTSALIGSFFGVAGTAVGLAIGSLISGLAAEYYERWIRKVHTTLHDRLIKKDSPAPSSRDVKITEKRKDGYTQYFTGVLLDEQPQEIKKKWNLKWALAIMVVTFIVGLSSITLIEFAKGSPISGGNNGTTLSGLLGSPTQTKTRPTTVVRPTWTDTEPPTSSWTSAPDSNEPTTTTVPTTTNSPPETMTTTPPHTSTSSPTTSVPVTTPQVTTAPQMTNQIQATS